jgi:spore coat protein JA
MAKPAPRSRSQVRLFHPFVSAFDPCPPIEIKTYQTPPQLYLGFQPPDLPQFSPAEALFCGTLWPSLYSPYHNREERAR